jgi:hypothetical protein
MRPEAGGAYKLRRAESCKCSNWVRAKCRIHEIEPNDVGLNFPHSIRYTQSIAQRTHPPTTTDREAGQFGLFALPRRINVTKNREIDFLATEPLGKVKAVFA